MKTQVQKLILIVSLLFIGTGTTFSANRYWIASTPANWNNTSNWSTSSGGSGGASVPGSSDVAIFNGTGGRNGNCTINATVNVRGIQISGYQGSLSQGSYSITIGSDDYTQSSGSFVGGSGIMIIDGNFSMTNGIFSAPSRLEIVEDYITTGGTFNHNNGLVVFNGSENTTYNPSIQDTFFSVQVNKAHPGAGKNQFNINSNDTLYVLNKLTVTNGRVLSNYVSIADTLHLESGMDNFTADVTIVGSPTSDLIFDASLDVDLSVRKNTRNDVVNYRITGAGTITDGGTLHLIKGTIAFPMSNLVVLDYTSITMNNNTIMSLPSGNLHITGNITNNGGRFISNSGTVFFNGTASSTHNLRTEDTLHNVIIDKTGSSSNDDVTITAGDTLHLTGSLTLTDGDVKTGAFRIEGGLSATSSISGVTSKIIFAGSGDVTLNLSSNSILNGDVEIRKTSGGTVSLSSKLVMDNTSAILRFYSGFFVTTSSNFIEVADNVSVSGFGLNSFVRGLIRKIGNDAFTFPIGNGNFYAPLTITAPSSATTEFTASYSHTNPNGLYSTSSKDITLNSLSASEYWILDRSGTASSVSVTLSFIDTRSGEIADMSALRVCRWDGSQWRDHGNGGTSGVATNGTVISSAAISSFSPFTLGSSNNMNPLPVTLVSFQAIMEGNNAILKWNTATEENNSHFEIQKSVDGIRFETIGRVEGYGTTLQAQSYQFVDKNPFNGKSYYRLRQVDFDGSNEYSNIIALFNGATQIPQESLTIFPNPNNGSNINIRAHIGSNNSATLKIFSANGKLVHAQQIQADNNGNIQTNISDLSNLENGIYFTRLENTTSALSYTLIIRK